MTAAEKIKNARGGLVLDFSFWGLTGLKLSLVEDSRHKTAWTDGKQLGYNPEFVLSLPMEELKGLCGHEIGHCVFYHPLRMAELKRELRIDHLEANICADYAINGILLRAGFKLPKGFLYDPRFDNLSLEQIAKLRKQEREQEKQRQEPKQEPQEGEGESQSRGDSQEDQDSEQDSPQTERDSEEEQDSDGESQEDQDSQEGDSVESGDSDARQGEEDQTGDSDDPRASQSQETEQGEDQDSAEDQEGQDIGNCGECREATNIEGEPLSPAEIREQIEDWNLSIAQAAQQSRAMGESLGEAIDTLVSEILSPKIDYRILLWEFAQRTAKSDYRKSPPNRRHILKGLYLPSLISEELQCIVIGNDTSGSIDQDKRNQAAAEISAILESYKSHAIVIHADDRIAKIEEYDSDDLPIDLSPRGSGGTNFCPVFQYVEDQGLAPDCLIYLTDLEGRFPDQEPLYPVLWIDLSDYAIEPPWGEVIRATD